MEKPIWEKHLDHSRFVRDLMVQLDFCTAPTKPDEPGSLRSAGPIRRFDGSLFWPKMKEAGHNDISYERCECYK